MNVYLNHMLALIVLANLYACSEGFLLLRSLVKTLKLKTGKIFLILYWPLSLLAAFLYFVSRYASGRMRSMFSLATSYWGLFLFVPFFIAASVITAGAALFRTRAGSRAAFGLTVRLAAAVLACGTLGLGSVSARYPGITRYGITTEKPLPGNGLRVAVISDIHTGAMVRKKQLARIVDKINTLEADLVLIAGDILDRDMDVYINENLNGEMARIKARYGVFAALGNHDYFGGNTGALEAQLAAAGVTLLTDEAASVDNALYVIGRNDAGRRGGGRKQLGGLVKGLDISLPLIVIDHQPLRLEEAENAGIDLQVSGHTHGGQVAPVNFVVKRMYENSYGLLYKGETAIVVSSGCGTWGPPVRIGTRSEIVCIDLKNPPGGISVMRN